MWELHRKQDGGKLDRSNEHVQNYVRAVAELSRELRENDGINVPAVNIWKAMMDKMGDFTFAREAQ